MQYLMVVLLLASCGSEYVDSFTAGRYDITTEIEFSTCEHFPRGMETLSRIVLGTNQQFCKEVDLRTSERETCDTRCDVVSEREIKTRGICHRNECSYSFVRTYTKISD